MAQAVLLTPKEVTNYYKQQELLANPEIKKLAQLDQEISNILSRTDITPHQKIQLYEGVLLRFNTLKQQIVNPTPVSPTSTPLTHTSSDEQYLDTDLETANHLNDIKSLLAALIKKSTKMRSMKNIKQPRRIRTNRESEDSMSSASDLPAEQRLMTPATDSLYGTPTEAFSSPMPNLISASTPTHTRSPILSTPSPKFNTATKRLKNMIVKDSLFAKALFNKELDGVQFDEQTLDNTLKYLTANEKYIAHLPDGVEDVGLRVYRNILNRNITIPPHYLKRYPLLNKIATQISQSPPKTRAKASAVNFVKWDQATKR